MSTSSTGTSTTVSGDSSRRLLHSSPESAMSSAPKSRHAAGARGRTRVTSSTAGRRAGIAVEGMMKRKRESGRTETTRRERHELTDREVLVATAVASDWSEWKVPK